MRMEQTDTIAKPTGKKKEVSNVNKNNNNPIYLSLK